MQIIKFLKEYKYIIGIVIIGLILRILWIENIPPSLNWDEISHGYNAYSILKDGRDEWGVSWPTIFRAYGDYKLPVYIYLTTLSELVFGLNTFAIRHISLMAGVGTIIFGYLLARKLFGQKVGLISAFLIAIEPWSFFLSRGAFEANLGQFFVISGVYFFLKGLEKTKLLILSSFLLGLSVWTYNSERIFVPLLLLWVLFIYRKNLRDTFKKSFLYNIFALTILTFFFIPMFIQLANIEGQARYSNLAILDQGAINYLEGVQTDNPMLKPLVNRYTYFGYHLLSNWASHYSPEFLFIKGGSQYQFNIPNQGLLYLIDLPFILLGLLSILKAKNNKTWIILGWLILAPVASSLTREAPHTLRAVTILPIPMILSALGITYLMDKWRGNKIILSGILLLYLIFGAFYLKSYFIEYPKNYSWSWQYGYKEAVSYAKDHYNEYDQIIITKKYGEPHEFVLFYWPWDPEKYRNDPNLERYAQSNWFWVDRFDKFYFVNDWEIPKNKNEEWKTERDEIINVNNKTLIITSPGTYPPDWRKLETINFLDGKPAFDILTNK